MRKYAIDYANEVLADKEPYALKVAKELRQAVGDRVLLDQAAQCLEDDCDYLKKIAESIKSSCCHIAGKAVKLRDALRQVKFIYGMPYKHDIVGQAIFDVIDSALAADNDSKTNN